MALALLTMHGLPTVTITHDAAAAMASPTTLLVGDITQVLPAHDGGSMGMEMTMLLACVWVLVATAGSIGLARASARVHMNRGALVDRPAAPALDLLGRSPPLQPSSVQLGVLLI